MRHDASCGVNGKRRTPNRSHCAPYDFRVSPRQRPVRVELTRSPNRRSMTAICELCSLMGQGGSSSGVDAFGCLRSLRARSALDGVSWVQRGSVEIAVGQRLAPATQSTPSSAPSLGRVGSSLLRIKSTRFQWFVKLGWSECLVGVPTVKISATHRLGDSARRVIARADETFRVRFDAAAQARLEARPWPHTFRRGKGQRTRLESRQRASL
jgi:hypothetical protein